MKVASLIEQYNLERPNSVEDSVKMEFLHRCEANLLDSVVYLYDPQEGEKTDEEWQEHLDNFDYDSDLLCDEPYDDIYMFYLDQRIALNNNDIKRYNATSRLYDNALLTFKQKYNRDHYPRQTRKMLLTHEVL